MEAADGLAMTGEGDGLGPDGSVYLDRYLPLADGLWFSTGCRCSALRSIGIRAAIAAAGPGATLLSVARQHRFNTWVLIRKLCYNPGIRSA